MSNPNDLPCVLIVDDEPLIMELLQGALDDAGFDTILAADVDEAFALLETNGSRLVGVVTDINLGSAVGGWDVGRRAREQNAEVAVVYCSGASVHEWATKGVPKSVVLTKPFAPAQVVVALVNQINASSPGGQDI
jgi:DNA-binding response OmpR family regulator